MRNPQKICREHNIYEHRAIHAAEIVAMEIAEDLQAMLLQDRVRPLHERLAEYLNIEQSEETNEAPKRKEKKGFPRGC